MAGYSTIGLKAITNSSLKLRVAGKEGSRKTEMQPQTHLPLIAANHN